MMKLSKKEEDYIFKAAAGCLPTKSQRQSTRETLHMIISDLESGLYWQWCTDEISQGDRMVVLAWTATAFRLALTSRVFGIEHAASTLRDTFMACRQLGIIGSAFVELWVGAGEDVVTFLGACRATGEV